ncbi:MAG TPA: FtsX-like permease family protein [Candidatus Udaeobacter sp.]|nr:FtsX-like permease family protein [Candidatus Udaeobacter sp.]
MRLLNLVWVNIFRSKRRTFLTVLSVLVALFLFSTLRTVITSFQAGVDFAGAQRLIVRNATSLIFPIPLAYKERIASVPGVTKLSYGNWFGGTYGDGRQFFAQFAIDPETYFGIYPEFILPAGELETFQRERTACVVGEGLAKEFGWKLGDTVPLKGTIYPGDWDFVIRAIYKGKDETVDTRQLFFHWNFLDERNFMGKGNVGIYMVEVADPALAPKVSETIDQLFANSTQETRTETEKAFQMSFVSMMGNIQFAVNLIGFAVVMAIILVAMNTMMMAARERLSEIAILKILGFSDGDVVGMVVLEAMVIALVGGALGCLIARVLFQSTNFTMGGMFPSFIVRGSTIAQGLLISVVLGALSALWPAIQANRLREAEALRHLS